MTNEVTAEGPEGGVPDAAIDLTVPPLPLACPPADLAPKPTTAPQPARLYQNACAQRDVLNQIVDCLTVRTVDDKTCGAIRDGTTDPPCTACIAGVSRADAGAGDGGDGGSFGAGPLLLDGPVARLNLGGCLTAHGDACGEPVEAAESCAVAACRECRSPVADDAALSQPLGAPKPADFEACMTAARAGACATLANRARDCLSRNPGSQAASICLAPGDFETRAQEFALLFCGPPPADAGGSR